MLSDFSSPAGFDLPACYQPGDETRPDSMRHEKRRAGGRAGGNFWYARSRVGLSGVPEWMGERAVGHRIGSDA